MSDFRDAMESAPAAANDSAPAPASAPAVSGSTPAPAGTEAPDQAPSAPGSGDAAAPPDPATGASPAAGASDPKKPAAKAAPAPPTPGAPDPKASGMVPAAALTEARTQLRTLRESYAWLPRDHAPAFRQFYESYQRDPVRAIAENISDLLTHPTHGPRLRSLMGGSVDDSEPPPDLRDKDTGETAYSPAQLRKWQEWNARQGDARLAERLSPIEQHIAEQRNRDRQMAAEAATRERREASVQRAKAVFADVRSNPHFGPNEAAIKARWEQHVQTMAPDAALYRAMSEVLSERIAGAGTAAADELAASLLRRAGAPNPNPGRPAANGGAPRNPVDFHESASRMFG